MHVILSSFLRDCGAIGWMQSFNKSIESGTITAVKNGDVARVAALLFFIIRLLVFQLTG